jgi:hypothetical protein
MRREYEGAIDMDERLVTDLIGACRKSQRRSRTCHPQLNTVDGGLEHQCARIHAPTLSLSEFFRIRIGRWQGR